jgi:hypothetical protein
LRVQALALRDGGRVRVVLANMTDEPLSVSLEVPGRRVATVRHLDDRTVHLAAIDPGAFRGSTEPIDLTDESLNVDLPPFGLATLDTESATA